MPRPTISPNGAPDQAVSPASKVLTIEQAAGSLRMHRLTVDKCIRARRPPVARLGKVSGIYRTDVDALLRRLRAQPR